MCLLFHKRRSNGWKRIQPVLWSALALVLFSSSAAQAETVRGRFQYRDFGDSQLRPIVDAEVEVWRCAPGFAGLCVWTKERTLHSDSTGAVSTQLPLAAPGEEIALRVLATNPQVVVWPETPIHVGPFYREPGEPGTPIHRFAFSNSDDLVFDFNFEEQWTAQHYHIAENVRRAALYANATLGFTLPRVSAQPTTITPNNSSFYNPINDTIVINVVSSFDDFVALHEYGHFIQEQIGSLPWKPAVHSFCQVSDPGLAWMEGFASYFAAAVGRSPWGVGLSSGFFSTDFFESGTFCEEPTDKPSRIMAESGIAK